jgi:hypothetical protein
LRARWLPAESPITADKPGRVFTARHTQFHRLQDSERSACACSPNSSAVAPALTPADLRIARSVPGHFEALLVCLFGILHVSNLSIAQQSSQPISSSPGLDFASPTPVLCIDTAVSPTDIQ